MDEDDFLGCCAGVADEAYEESLLRPPPTRIKKRVAVCLGYIGTAYHGLQQVQLGCDSSIPTIEDAFLKALVGSGLCHRDWATHVSEVNGWSRSSRTDKGVHAAGNILSFDILMDKDGREVEKLNAELPADIRVFGVVRHKKSFIARQECDTRDYEYLVPTYAFQPSARESTSAESPRFFYTGNKFEYTDAVEALLRRTIQRFAGTHNFHNFTQGGKADTPQMTRHLRALSVTDPFLLEGTQYVKVKLKGQSFLLKMIRKILGLLISIGRGDVGAEVFEHVFSTKRTVSIPTAPANGLLLDTVYFAHFNEVHVPLGYQAVDFNTPYYSAPREAFKISSLYPTIAKVERDDTPMESFLNALDRWPVSVDSASVAHRFHATPVQEPAGAMPSDCPTVAEGVEE